MDCRVEPPLYPEGTDLEQKEKVLEEWFYRDVPHPEFLALEEKAREMNFPILNRHSARLLAFLVRLYRPQKILELGSGFGYSAAWMAWANPQCEITLCDFMEKQTIQARNLLEKLYPETCVSTYHGNVMDHLEELQEQSYDLIFVDLDKIFYKRVFDAFIDTLSKSGLMIMDNVFVAGQMFMREPKKKKGLAEVNKVLESLREQGRDFEILPSGDGLLLIRS